MVYLCLISRCSLFIISSGESYVTAFDENFPVFLFELFVTSADKIFDAIINIVKSSIDFFKLFPPVFCIFLFYIIMVIFYLRYFVKKLSNFASETFIYCGLS